MRCMKCDALFSSYTQLNDHNRESHNNEPFECPICGRRIQMAHRMAIHIQQCENRKESVCSICRKRFKSFLYLREHLKSVHVNGLPKKCTMCGLRFDTPAALEAHSYEVHADALNTNLPAPDPLDLTGTDVEIESPLKKLYTRYWLAIRTHYKFDPLVHVYNFRIAQQENDMLSNLVKTVYSHQQGIFKLNVSLGLILEHKPTGLFRYYYAGQNNQLLDEPRRIASRKDLHDLTNDLDDLDLYQQGTLARPDTTHIVHKISNITITTVHIANSVPIGGTANFTEETTNILKTNKHILVMDKDVKGKKIKDNLCFFRCLASEINKMNFPSEKHVRKLVDQWLNYQENSGLKVVRNFDFFKGVTLQDMSDIEECFQCNVNVYSLTPSRDQNGAPIATTVFRSTKLYKQFLFLNYFQNHFSRITSINHYARTWICKECGRIIDTQRLYALHLRQCQGQVRTVYPGGGFGLPQTIFDKLREEGLIENDHFYPFYIVYDFECMFEKVADEWNCAEKLKYENQLIPISVSVCSNVPGYLSAYCIISSDPNDLVEKFIDYASTIAEEACRLTKDKFCYITEFINEQTDAITTEQSAHTCTSSSETRHSSPVYQKLCHRWESIEEEWNTWLTKVPIVGFNSSRFDINLIRRFMIPILMTKKSGINSCITKGSAYITLATDNLIFLDICHFLAAGISYSKWLGGFGVSETKGKFPYELLTSFDKLYQEEIPPQSDFYSSLKQAPISDADYCYLKDIWKQNNFRNMFDFLRWYNNLDVTPFVLALEKMRKVFMTMDIDLLKQGCVSLPGLAMTHMFKTVRPDFIFQLYDNKFKKYHKLVEENIVGGPAIIFNRCTVVGTGTIKKNGPTPQSIVGYDCNGLYLNALRQHMPTGLAAIWEPVGGIGESIATKKGSMDKQTISKNLFHNYNLIFCKRQTGSGFDETLAVLYTYHCRQAQSNMILSLQYKWNGGQKIFYVDGSQLAVDGYIPELGLIIQYDGCYFHGHRCHLTSSFAESELQKRAQHTSRITGLLRKTGNQIVSIRECEFQWCKTADPYLAQYISQLRLKSTHGPQLTVGQMLEHIAREEFFGMVEVDLQVPFWRPDLREKMREFPPIFKNSLVTIDDIGSEMANYAKANNLMKKPRRCLISSYFGVKILLPTPLLKWYMESGIVITRIYCAIEYSPMKTFAHLVDEVTEHRRSADRDKAYQSYGETFKLLGNSYYGKCLTNIEKHRKVQYCDRLGASKAINSPRFRSIETIGSGIYEVHSAKSVNCFKLPINIGYFVYGYSKLRMLQFYYGFLCKVLTFDSFELLEMDTDSLYFSLAGTTLENTIKSDKRWLYEHLKHQFLVTDEMSKRLTGIFKLEWSGKVMICTAPKSYICFTKEIDVDGTSVISNVKLSTKGVSKVTNQISAADFEAALFRKEMIEGTNRGFKMKNGDLYQYSQKRRALVFLYIKRVVEEDGIHTNPLDL